MASEAEGTTGAAPAAYPGFDVMAAQRAWDPVTRAVVAGRLSPGRPQALSEAEVRTLTAAARRLLAEERPEVLAFVVAHFDSRLRSDLGEGQRETGVPPEADLVRRGLAALDRAAGGGGAAFAGLPASQQSDLLAALAAGRAAPADAFAGLPQKALFNKLLGLAAEALASHPGVWSEIGYAGPAYPRGYYRMGRGILDPWEPRAEGAARQGAAGTREARARAGARDGRPAGLDQQRPGAGDDDGRRGRGGAQREGRDGWRNGSARDGRGRG
jgi:hypothetical protein